MPRPAVIHLLKPHSLVSTACAKIVERHLATDKIDDVTCSRCLQRPAALRVLVPDLRRRLRKAGYTGEDKVLRDITDLRHKNPTAAAVKAAIRVAMAAEKKGNT